MSADIVGDLREAQAALARVRALLERAETTPTARFIHPSGLRAALDGDA